MVLAILALNTAEAGEGALELVSLQVQRLQEAGIPVDYEGPIVSCPASPPDRGAEGVAASSAGCVHLVLRTVGDHQVLTADSAAAELMNHAITLERGPMPLGELVIALESTLEEASGVDVAVTCSLHPALLTDLPGGPIDARSLLAGVWLRHPGQAETPPVARLGWRVIDRGNGSVGIFLGGIQVPDPALEERWVHAVPLDRPPGPTKDREWLLRVALEQARADDDPWSTPEERAAAVASLEAQLAAEIAKKAAAAADR